MAENTPQKGSFLISEPFLPDPNFKRTVIILTEHNNDGTVGFVLNKRMEISLHDAMEDFPSVDIPIYFGGPVQPDTLHFIHTIDILEGRHEIFDGLYWGGNFEALKAMAAKKFIKKENIIFFIGYSGWSPDQLDSEIKEKSWIVTPAKPELLFTDNQDDLWKTVLQSMDQKYSIIANFPEDPSLN